MNDSSHEEFPNPETQAELPGSHSSHRKDGVEIFSDGDGSSTQPRHVLNDQHPILPDERTVISQGKPDAKSLSRFGSSPGELGQMLLGERLGHFELEEFIGGGGMGAVFRGHDTALGRSVAIKVLLRQYAADEETIKRFQNEAQSAARLDHENIARVYYVGEDRGWHYIVLEYVEGENIRDLVQRTGPLSLVDVVSYTLQICEALTHAAGRDVVHRDIKPSNVLVTADGRAKLVDMGLARLRQVEHSHDDLTASGVTLGTFDYISPEQARDPRGADVRSDLYSLGCTLFYMLTGQPPFPEGTVLQKLLQHQGDTPPDPRDLRPDAPDELCRITKKLLAKNPRDRFQDPDSLVAELLTVADELSFNQPGPGVFPKDALATKWYQRHLPWIVPVALLFVITLVVYQSGMGSSTPPPRSPRAYVASETLPKAEERDGASSVTAAPASVPTEDRSQASSDPVTTSPQETTPKKNADPAGVAVSADAGPMETTPAATVPANQESTPPETAEATLDPPNGVGPGPTEPDPIAPKAVATEQVLVVDGKGDEENTYASLFEACRAVEGKSTIELRFNGPLAAPEKPIRLEHKITLRGAKGFYPVVRFRPGNGDAVHPHSMITLAGGELTVANVHLEFEIPRQLHADGWSLFEVTSAERIRLNKCWLTIRNAADDLSAFYKSVAFITVLAPPNAEPPLMQIELTHCVARGEATFLRGNALNAVELAWNNGFLTTSERFVEIEGYDQELSGLSELDIQLKHMTAYLGKGFCRMQTSIDQSHLMPTRLDCTNCIFITGDAPFLEQHGPADVAQFQNYVSWKADRNFYEGVETFWKIDSFQDDVHELDWSAWQEHWQNGEGPERPLPVEWKHQLPMGMACSEQDYSDFELTASESNPAYAAAPDGMTDVGLMFQEVAPLPSPEIMPLDRPPGSEDESPSARVPE